MLVKNLIADRPEPPLPNLDHRTTHNLKNPFQTKLIHQEQYPTTPVRLAITGEANFLVGMGGSVISQGTSGDITRDPDRVALGCDTESFTDIYRIPSH